MEYGFVAVPDVDTIKSLFAKEMPNSRIGELLPHHWISADYSLPSWESQIQTELPSKDEGEEHYAQKR